MSGLIADTLIKAAASPVHLRPVDPDLVSVVIVNYNGMKFLQACIDSLHKAFKTYRYEIVIVDNLSTDGSREWLAQRVDIIYVESAENLGFTGGNNLGARQARGGNLLFINNDTLVQSALDPMIDALADPKAGIVGCRLVYGDGRQQFSFGYDHTALRLVLSWLGVEKKYWLPKAFRRVETDVEKYHNSITNVDWVSGACFSIRRVDWELLQGFDTNFFMYCEDVDLCVRVRQLGKRVQYLPEVLVTHYEGSGRVWIGAAALMRTVNSYMLFSLKHHSPWAFRSMTRTLGLVFLARSQAFRLVASMARDRADVLRDKSSAYRAAGLCLMRGKPVYGLAGAKC